MTSSVKRVRPVFKSRNFFWNFDVFRKKAKLVFARCVRQFFRFGQIPSTSASVLASSVKREHPEHPVSKSWNFDVLRKKAKLVFARCVRQFFHFGQIPSTSASVLASSVKRGHPVFKSFQMQLPDGLRGCRGCRGCGGPTRPGTRPTFRCPPSVTAWTTATSVKCTSPTSTSGCSRRTASEAAEAVEVQPRQVQGRRSKVLPPSQR